MEDPAALASSPEGHRSQFQVIRDVIALTKPRITIMVMFTTFGGYWLALQYFRMSATVATLAPLLAGSAMVVGGANALNMYIERDSDRFMRRTRTRPLPAGRLAPEVALAVGIGLSALAVPIMGFAVSAMTGVLAALALLSYVLIYTPLKSKTPSALLIGAVPGAIPPLMGWSAARGTIDGPGIVLFGILFFWQVPHFLAIATFRKEEYARANMAVLPVVAGDRVTRHHIVRYLAALLLTSMLLVPYGVGGWAYMLTALVLGLVFFAVGLWGLRRSAGDRWARWLFFTSMVYLTGMFVALTLGSTGNPTAPSPDRSASVDVQRF